MCKWADDSQCFILEHFDIICNSPSLIYHYALPFSPSSSWLHKYHTPELLQLPKVIKGAKAEWGTCSRTVSFDSEVWSLSYQNNSIAVGSESSDIVILDAITGSQISILSGHTDWVICLTFSLDGKLLVSGSPDKTVKLWDVQTGGVVKTFYGHTKRVWSVSISADHTRIASGSWDNTLRLWDIQTGECLCTIKQQKTVRHVSFSPMDPQHLISISGDKVWWWDVNGHQILPTHNGSYISFSPDHTQFALCNGKVVTIQHLSSGTIVAKFHVAIGSIKHCCFSPDGRLVAAAAQSTAYVWDIVNPEPHLIATFVGHINGIESLVFSSPSSLISASWDRSVRFWKIGALSADQAATDTPIELPSIKSVSLQARAGIAISNDEDGEVKTWDLSTGICKTTLQIPGAKDISIGGGDLKLIDGRLIFAWYQDEEIHIWDTGKGELTKTLDVLKPSYSLGLRIAGDGSKVILLLDRSIQAWSMWTWEPLGKVKLGLKETPYLDSLCIDSSRVCIHSEDSSAKEGWDFGIGGSSPVPFDPSSGRPYLDFIGGASWQTNHPPWIKDTATGKEVFKLRGRYAEPSDVQWDGQYLVAGYESGEILIVDFHHMLPQ